MNIVSVSWGDHLSFGDGDGRLDTPEKLQRRLPVWRDELGAGALHWRMLRSRIPGNVRRGSRLPSSVGSGGQYASAGTTSRSCPRWLARPVSRRGSTSPLFDEGWPLAPEHVRRVSYHNEMHGQHVAWQSRLTRDHPQWLVIDRAGREQQEGVVSLAYPEARRAFIDRWMSLIEADEFDGLVRVPPFTVAAGRYRRPVRVQRAGAAGLPATRYGVDVDARAVRHPGLARPARLRI